MRKNWEIVKGCERLTSGCDSCPSYWDSQENGWDYTCTPQMQNLSIPQDDQFTKMYTVALGSDLFHESVPLSDLKKIFKVMNNSQHHYFEIVTKRIERAYCVSKKLEWTQNILLGVALESGEYRFRVDFLRKIPAFYKYISACPILGEFPNIDLTGINGVSVGEETYGLKRPMEKKWLKDLKKQCEEQGVSFSLSESYLWRAS
jgi:protein gp37